MPSYRIRLINSHFESVDEVNFVSLDAAQKSAIATAMTIVSEAIVAGERTSAVELQISETEELLSRQVVALSVTDLTTTR